MYFYICMTGSAAEFCVAHCLNKDMDFSNFIEKSRAGHATVL